MIEKIKDTFEPYMIRPIIYQSVTRISIGFTLALLWDRYINTAGLLSMVEHAFFVVGMFFLAFAWLQYLRLDGVTLHHLLEEKQIKKKPKRHATADIADFADEKIISFDELEPEEKTICLLFSNLICMVIFMGPAIVAMVI